MRACMHARTCACVRVGVSLLCVRVPVCMCVSVSGFVEPVEQLSLLNFGGDGSDQSVAEGRTTADLERDWSPASQAVDEIREKFGRDAISAASSINAVGRRELGQSPWGPSEEKPGDALP